MRLDFWTVATLGIDLPIKLVYVWRVLVRYRQHDERLIILINGKVL